MGRDCEHQARIGRFMPHVPICLCHGESLPAAPPARGDGTVIVSLVLGPGPANGQGGVFLELKQENQLGILEGQLLSSLMTSTGAWPGFCWY